MEWLKFLSLSSLCFAVLGLNLNVHAVGSTLPVADEDFGCLDRARAERYVSDFGIDVASFGGMELCDPKIDSKKLFNDLQLIEEGHFAGQRKNLFIRDFVPRESYLSWLKTETLGVQRGNDVPYATAYNSGGYFTMQDGWAKLSTLGRVGTIIHEARHTEGYTHTQCQHGPYKDTSVSGCDSSIEGKGSHAIEMEYYARVVTQGENFHPVYQAMARLMLVARSNFVFNTNPLILKDALLARTDKGLSLFKDGSRRDIAWEESPGPNTVMKRTSFGASLFELPGKASAIEYDGTAPARLVADSFSYYKLLGLQAVADLRDFEELDSGLKRYAASVDVKSNLRSFRFAQGQWSSAHLLDGATRFVTTDPTGKEGLYALLVNGTYCQLNLQTLNCSQDANLWPPQAQNFVSFEGELLRLDNLGTVTNPDGSNWADLNGEHVFDLIKIPAYDVFESSMNY